MTQVFNLVGLHDCDTDLATPALRRLIDPSFPGDFDVILVDQDLGFCLLGFAHRFGYPGVVAASPFPSAFWLDQLMGIPPASAIR